MESRFSKIENKEEWRTLLNRALFKTFFHSLEWEEFLEQHFNWLKFEHYNWRNQALLSLAGVGKKLISHPFCEYGGVLPLISKINGQQFKQELFEEFKASIKISFHPALMDYFENLNDNENQRETYLVGDLQKQTPDQLWEGLDRNRHRSIKTALDQGFKVEKCKSSQDLERLYDFYVENLKKHKTLAYPFSFFEYFFKSPEAEIILVKKNGRLVGGNIFLFYNKFVHSFLCGFNEKYRKFGVHSLVIWSEMRRAQQKGFEVFDLGATRKMSSLEGFKQRWGGRVFPIFELKNYTGESKLRNSFLRDVWSCLPTPLIKILSPRFIKHKL